MTGGYGLTFTNSSICPASGVTGDQLLSAFNCSTFYLLSPSALVDMSKGKAEIHDLISMDSPPDHLIAYDVPVCTDFHTTDQKCEFETARLFVTDGVQLYNNEEKTEMVFPVGIGHGDSGCGSFKYQTSPVGNIDYKLDRAAFMNPTNFLNNVACHWTISTENNTSIMLVFSKLNIKYCLDSCLCDYLAIYEDMVNSTTIIGKYCGRRSKFTLYTNLNLVHITLNMIVFYNTDSDFGFKLSYSSIPKDEILVLSTPERILANDGFISISGSVPWYKKSDQFVYEWQIRTDEAYLLSVNFVFSETCGAALFSIYDGPKSDNSIIYSSYLSSDITGTTNASGFVALLQFQSLCDNADLHITYNSRMRSFSYNYTDDSESFREVSLNATQAFDGFNITADRSKSRMFVGYIFNVPQGKFVTLNFSKYSFEGANIRSCEAEGLVIYDGLPGSSDKYGPYCGMEILTYIFGHMYRSYRILSSTNVMSVLYYWYKDSGFDSVNLELGVSATDCMGISNWYKLNTEFTDANYSIYEGITNINVTMNAETCLRLQILPDEKPINITFGLNVQIRSGTLAVSEGWIQADFKVRFQKQSSCDYRFYSHSDGKHGSWKNSINLNCWSLPLGYAMTLSGTGKENKACVSDTFNYLSPLGFIKSYDSTICGKISFSCNSIYRPLKFALTAPLELTRTHHYSIKFYSTHEMDTKISVNINETKKPGYDYQVPVIYVTHLPFYWKSSWSSVVIFELLYQHSATCGVAFKWFFMEYRLLPSTYPKAEMAGEACPGYTHRYRDHCYEIQKEDDPQNTLTWSQAKNKCKKRDGYMLTTNSQEELSFIQGLLVEQTYDQISQPSRFYFLGINLRNRVSYARYKCFNRATSKLSCVANENA